MNYYFSLLEDFFSLKNTLCEKLNTVQVQEQDQKNENILTIEQHLGTNPSFFLCDSIFDIYWKIGLPKTVSSSDESEKKKNPQNFSLTNDASGRFVSRWTRISNAYFNKNINPIIDLLTIDLIESRIPKIIKEKYPNLISQNVFPSLYIDEGSSIREVSADELQKVYKFHPKILYEGAHIEIISNIPFQKNRKTTKFTIKNNQVFVSFNYSSDIFVKIMINNNNNLVFYLPGEFVNKVTLLSEKSSCLFPNKGNISNLKPTDLNLDNKKYDNFNSLANETLKNLKEKYKGENYLILHQYVKAIINAIASDTQKLSQEEINAISESSYSLKNLYELDKEYLFPCDSDKDYKVVAKNLGEILSGLYVFNKYPEQSFDYLYYPSASNNVLADFFGVKKIKTSAGEKEVITSFSVKTKASSGTSFTGVKINKNVNLNNINPKVLSAIKFLINNKDEEDEGDDSKTSKSGNRYYDLFLLCYPEYITKYTEALKRVFGINKNLSNEEFWNRNNLYKWFDEIRKEYGGTEEQINKFIEKMKICFSEMNYVPHASTISGIKNLVSQSAAKTNPRFMLYILASYIKNLLNNDEEYLFGLNYVLKVASPTLFNYIVVECTKNSVYFNLFSSNAPKTLYYFYYNSTMSAAQKFLSFQFINYDNLNISEDIKTSPADGPENLSDKKNLNILLKKVYDRLYK